MSYNGKHEAPMTVPCDACGLDTTTPQIVEHGYAQGSYLGSMAFVCPSCFLPLAAAREALVRKIRARAATARQ